MGAPPILASGLARFATIQPTVLFALAALGGTALAALGPRRAGPWFDRLARGLTRDLVAGESADILTYPGERSANTCVDIRETIDTAFSWFITFATH